MKTDIEVLDGAIELVEADGGWCQGISFKDAAAYCLEGAIRQAAGWPVKWIWGQSVVQARRQAAHTAEVNQQVARLEKLVYRLALVFQYNTGGPPAMWTSLHELNDDDYTTQDEAVLVLKRAHAHLLPPRSSDH
jgi:hypothetical protein